MATAGGKFAWSVYFMEACLLGGFMVSACGFATLLEHPASPAHLPSATARRALMALAMALTALLLLTSRFGKRTGAQMNPAVTLAAWRMGRMPARDAAMYGVFQFLGGAMGVGLYRLLIPAYAGHTAVRYAATTPAAGAAAAFVAEFIISFVLLSTVLLLNRHSRLVYWTPFVAACLVGVYVFAESPLSGMSMNPARTLASALYAGNFSELWIYFTAPPLAMLTAVEVQRALGRRQLCPKAVHSRAVPCHCPCDCLDVKKLADLQTIESQHVTERAAHAV